MNQLVRVSLLGLLLVGAEANAQQRRAPVRKNLAPGVLTVIPIDGKGGETFTGPMEIPALVNIPGLEWTPNFTAKSNTLIEKSRRVILRREVWNLEFAFKPLRMLEIDVPQPDKRMRRKLIWYMVYRVKYLGNDLAPAPRKSGVYVTYPSTTEVAYEWKRFFPRFTLESKEYQKSYMDRVLPAARRIIEAREKVGPLLDTVQMTRANVMRSDARVDRSVWGLVTWEDVDPRIDYFSVYVSGLTNAYKIADPTTSNPRKRFAYKTLQLNFWRPGDSVFEHEKEIRFGVPIDEDPLRQEEILKTFGLPERLDHRWIYR